MHTYLLLNAKHLFIGFLGGIAVLTLALIIQAKSSDNLGAVTSNGDLIGIYNASGMVLRDGYGSALAVDQYGRLIATSTNP